MTINSQEDLLVEITVFEDRRYDAMLRRDVTYLSAMFGDGRAYTHSSGVRQDAAEYLHGLAAGTDIYRNIEHGINRIVRLADRELVYGWQRMTVNSDGDLRQWIICPWRYCRGAEVAGLQWVDEEAAKLASIRAAALPTGLRQSVIPGSCWPTAAGSAPRSCTNFAAIPTRLPGLRCWPFSPMCAGKVTNALTEMLITTDHRIGTRAERRVEGELVEGLKRVASKPALLFKLASVSLAKPEGNVREVCSPQRTSSGPLFVKEVVSASAPGSEWIYRLHGFRRDACAWPYSAG